MLQPLLIFELSLDAAIVSVVECPGESVRYMVVIRKPSGFLQDTESGLLDPVFRVLISVS